MNKIHRLAGLGQSIWLDYIRRAFIESGELQELINDGVSGVTSNPAIFAAAIAGSEDYDAVLRDLGAAGLPAIHIYEALAVEDIQAAADALRPVFERTAGDDGYVSLEVSPELADDTESTVEEARRLYALVDRPNLMIKVPATPAGVAAIKTLIGEGINVNVTLMFSLAHYDASAAWNSWWRMAVTPARWPQWLPFSLAGSTRPLTPSWQPWAMSWPARWRAKPLSPMPK